MHIYTLHHAILNLDFYLNWEAFLDLYIISSHSSLPISLLLGLYLAQTNSLPHECWVGYQEALKLRALQGTKNASLARL